MSIRYRIFFGEPCLRTVNRFLAHSGNVDVGAVAVGSNTFTSGRLDFGCGTQTYFNLNNSSFPTHIRRSPVLRSPRLKEVCTVYILCVVCSCIVCTDQAHNSLFAFEHRRSMGKSTHEWYRWRLKANTTCQAMPSFLLFRFCFVRLSTKFLPLSLPLHYLFSAVTWNSQLSKWVQKKKDGKPNTKIKSAIKINTAMMILPFKGTSGRTGSTYHHSITHVHGICTFMHSVVGEKDKPTIESWQLKL